jgi:hypothetical protein
MSMNKKLGYNLERLFHILLATAMICLGIFTKGFEWFTFVGIFVWGLIIGGLDE